MATTHQKTVRSAIAPLVGDARIAAPLTSQLLAGECLTVLDGRGDWLSVRGDDGYEGWTHAGYLMPASGNEASWRIGLGCQVRDVLGTSRLLPLGARIAPGAEVLSGQAIDADLRAMRFPLNGEAVARSGETLFVGASYLWGGVTPWGCDCSGFVQRVYALHGVRLPRDAWQQASKGHSITSDPTADHEPGDLLFFSDRDDARITHVGLALGAGRMVHSSLMRGGIAIEQLLSTDPYVARLRAQCIEVRRVLP